MTSRYAPYVDTTLWPPFDLAKMAEHVKNLEGAILAFIVWDSTSGSELIPCWGGQHAYAIVPGRENWYHEYIYSFINVRPDAYLVASFGGASNTPLAVAAFQQKKEPSQLAAAYQSVLDAYPKAGGRGSGTVFKAIDFDIEGAWIGFANRKSIDLRSAALSILQTQDNPELDVWFTLPVMPFGLTDDGRYVVQSALDHNVEITGINIMAMDYGSAYQGNMGEYAIQAMNSLFEQLKELFGHKKTDSQIWSMIGVTPMIGQNDTPGEVFYPDDARQVREFVELQGAGMIGIWSANRDRSCGGGGEVAASRPAAEPNCSGIEQDKYEFSKIFSQSNSAKGARVPQGLDADQTRES